jgi:type I restriction enzyme S subunit
VIPKISKDDILTLPVPELVLALGEQLLAIHNALEHAIRYAQRLTTAAKLLIEGLIDGKLTEADLQAAHTDRDADRTILRRLTAKGLDVADEPLLFPDLAQLEMALADAGGRAP